MPPGWRLEGDALDVCGLRLAMQRIAVSHWQPRVTLRSWALAPLHRDGDTLCVPCADEEALWLGAWAEPAGGSGTVALREADGVAASLISVPRDQALTALSGGLPIGRQPGRSQRQLRLAVQPLEGLGADIALALMAPGDWVALSGRPWITLTGPPPRPPRLG